MVSVIKLILHTDICSSILFLSVVVSDLIGQADKCLMAALVFSYFGFICLKCDEVETHLLSLSPSIFMVQKLWSIPQSGFSSYIICSCWTCDDSHSLSSLEEFPQVYRNKKNLPSSCLLSTLHSCFFSQRVLPRLYCLIAFISPGCVHHSGMCVFHFPSYKRSWQPRSVIVLALRLLVMPALDVIKESRLETVLFIYLKSFLKLCWMTKLHEPAKCSLVELKAG